MKVQSNNVKKVVVEKIQIVNAIDNLGSKTYNYRCKLLSEVIRDILIYSEVAMSDEVDKDADIRSLIAKLSSRVQADNLNRLNGVELFKHIPLSAFDDEFYTATEAEYSLLRSYFEYLVQVLKDTNELTVYNELFNDDLPARAAVEVSSPKVDAKVLNTVEPTVAQPFATPQSPTTPGEVNVEVKQQRKPTEAEIEAMALGEPVPTRSSSIMGSLEV